MAGSASVVDVEVMASRTLGNTFPMMQGDPRRAAHALGVVRETGGAGRIAGITDAFLTVESGPTVRDTLAILEQGSGIRTRCTVLETRTTTVRARLMTAATVCVVVLVRTRRAGGQTLAAVGAQQGQLGAARPTVPPTGTGGTGGPAGLTCSSFCEISNWTDGQTAAEVDEGLGVSAGLAVVWRPRT